MGRVNIASYGLALGAVGQTIIFGCSFPRVPDWLLVLPLLVPWLIVYAISFCREPPCGPRAFRRALALALFGYAFFSAMAEIVHAFTSVRLEGHCSYSLARILMYSPAVSFAVLIRVWFKIRRFEMPGNAVVEPE